MTSYIDFVLIIQAAHVSHVAQPAHVTHVAQPAHVSHVAQPAHVQTVQVAQPTYVDDLAAHVDHVASGETN